ncbi:GNAT family N-acetyltransferase [Limoniibacter endophyticus]|uniref:Ribosomal-protein-alanine N-acetyltransferase n=1 Tax=Limoniibacter endophyticus TaxID=1565040 RepID=A0A8J3DS78_9HYPH|nr:GNAT family protein [Limoniibacter endophyticus]GHC71565.1 ribosomal-protein-alanine N-acetyltransferase [Limoniibacter endophyticus]
MLEWLVERAPPLSLTGGRLILRSPQKGDYEEWATLRAESRTFLEPWEPSWAANELDYITYRTRLRAITREAKKGHAVAFFIRKRSDLDLVGGITLSNIRYGVTQAGSIGYWVGARHAGQGYMVDAVELLVSHAFGKLGLHRLEAACIPSNRRSMRVLEKSGFQKEGLLRSYLRINGEWQDHFLYSRVAPTHPDLATRG